MSMEELLRYITYLLQGSRVPPHLQVSVALLVAEEIAEEVARRIPTPKPPTSKVDVFREVKLPEIIDVPGSGVLDELTVMSRSGDYGVSIYVGGRLMLIGSFKDLMELSEYVNWISAVENNGRYVLVVRDVGFQGGISIRFFNLLKQVTLDTVIIKVRTW